MPSIEKHQSQYKHNRKLLDADVFKDNISFVDWHVTILFYSAVHLVERELSKHKCHSDNHETRMKHVKMVHPLNRVCDEYNSLSWQSRRARYDCVKFTPEDMQVIKSDYKAIEKLLDSAG